MRLTKSIKNIKLALAALVMGMLSQSVLAVPVYYSFTGNVNVITDAAGIAAASSVSIGDAVSYIYLVDRDLHGSTTKTTGSVESIAPDTSTIDYFYADFIDGGLISQVGAGSLNGPNNTAEFNFGSNSSVSASLRGGSQNDDLGLYTQVPNRWNQGSVWTGFKRAYNESGLFSTLTTRLTLAAISSTNPIAHSVPELDASGALIVFALLAALLAIGIERRRPQMMPA